MKKVFRISTLLSILVLIVANALFAFVLIVNRAQIRFNKKDLAHCTFFDIKTELLFQDQNTIKWLDDEEMMIDGNYFDVLRIADLGNGKSRVYVYGDDIETGLTKTMKDHDLHKANGKKHHSSFADLLKLKTYTKHSYLNSLLCAEDLVFRSLSMTTEEGHFNLPYHPPAV